MIAIVTSKELSQNVIDEIKQNNYSILRKDTTILDQSDKNGKTSIMHAVESKNSMALSILLTRGADVTLQTKDGKTALDLALENHHEESVRQLKAAGAKIGNTDLQASLKDALSARKALLKENKNSNELATNKESIKNLLAEGASLYSLDDKSEPSKKLFATSSRTNDKATIDNIKNELTSDKRRLIARGLKTRLNSVKNYFINQKMYEADKVELTTIKLEQQALKKFLNKPSSRERS